MDSTTETKQKAPNKIIIALVLLLLAVIVAATAIIVVTLNKDGEKDNGLTIGYAADATVLLDQQSIQAAMDAAMENAKNGNIGLSYQNDAYSEDGTNFDCYIANSVANIYDMFLTIYADAEMTDQIYLSGLVPPGSGFERITLDRSLDLGDHRVYVVLSQIDLDEETGEQVLCHQVAYTMDFHVIE